MTAAHRRTQAGVDGNPGSEAPRPASGGATPGRQGDPTEPAHRIDALRPSTAEVAALELLLRVEEQARAAADVVELQHLIVNQSRKITRARQIFLVTLSAYGRAKVVCVSGISTIDSTSSMVTGIATMVERLEREAGLRSRVEFTLPAYCAADSDLAIAYPFREIAWLPFSTRGGEPFAGMVMARETVWASGEMAVSDRLAAAFAHAWRELDPPRVMSRGRMRRQLWTGAACAATLVCLALPVPITALAPTEIVAAQPAVVAAPLDGVIEAVVVDPNTAVKAGDVLVRFSETTLRNRREIATWDVSVAEAKVKQLTMLAFADAKGRQELGLAEAELSLKRAELTYASELLERTVLRAPRDGIAIFADRRSLVGKPVTTGERLMEIAEQSRIEARIDVAIADAIALRQGGTVKLFLDVDPLRPLGGTISRADYKARPSDADVLAFRAFAELARDAGATPRIGLRGTAQIRGDTAPLAMTLFRRPVSAVRQWLGL